LFLQIRQKIITSAFLRSLRDPFPAARQAGILGMAATQNYYHLREISSKLLPALCIATMDPEKGVRDQVCVNLNLNISYGFYKFISVL
jgi:SCY1-like protein 1